MFSWSGRLPYLLLDKDLVPLFCSLLRDPDKVWLLSGPGLVALLVILVFYGLLATVLYGLACRNPGRGSSFRVAAGDGVYLKVAR